MVLTRTDENELLTALHVSAFQEAAPWQLFLTRLRDRTEADRCRLFIRPNIALDWRMAEEVVARGVPQDDDAPPPPPFEELRVGRVYSGEELPGERTGKERHLHVVWPDGGELVISLIRAKPDFRARDAALLASLAPHLAIALRARMEVARERRRRQIAEHALGGGFNLCWLLVDARGRVIDSDSGGARLMEEGRVLRRSAEGRLRLPYAEAEELLDSELANPGPGPRAAWLSIDPPIQMVVMHPPVAVAQTLASPHSLILLREVRGDALGQGRYLPELFRLTRSEAALAAELAEGATLADAAESLGLTIETVRNYSKRIYVKTGAHGQADLVRIVLNGTSMLG